MKKIVSICDFPSQSRFLAFRGKKAYLGNIMILQGGVEDVRSFYTRTVSLYPDERLLILNCAVRAGSAKITPTDSGGTIYWLPMSESNCHDKSELYCDHYMSDWKSYLGNKGIVVIHCNEGLFRSVALKEEFERRFLMS